MSIKPLRTEKTLREAALGKYTFAVEPKLNKIDLRLMVHKLFGVDAVKVQTSIVPGKSYRTGKKSRMAYKSDWKKAIVTVKSGQKIDLFETK